MKFKVGDRVFSPIWPDLWNNSTVIRAEKGLHFPYTIENNKDNNSWTTGSFLESELEIFKEDSAMSELEELRKFKEEAIKKHPNLVKCKMEIFVENLMRDYLKEKIDYGAFSPLESAILEAIQYGQENPVK